MKQKTYKTFAKLSAWLLFFISLSNCEIQENFEYVPSNSTKYLNMTAMEYIESHDSLSMFEEAIKATGLESYYSGTDSKTFIAPFNVAFRDYMADNGYSSVSDIPAPILRNMLLYHIVKEIVSFDDPDLIEVDNPIEYNTENGQIMVLSHNSNYEGVINDGTNYSIKIVTSNLTPTNGVIHIVHSLVYYHAITASNEIPEADYDTIYTLQDAYTNAGDNADVNYGSDTLIRVKDVTGSSNWDRKGYLMFDTKDFIKEGVVSEYKLELAVNFAAGKGYPIYVYPVQDTTWEESVITWNNASTAESTSVGSTISSDVSKFQFEITDYIKSLATPRKITLMLAAEPGSDDTNDLVSREDGTRPAPMILARLVTSISSLVLDKNDGFSCSSGDVVILSNDKLNSDGAAATDIVYTLTEVPANGWLFLGGEAMSVEDKFNQLDIDYGNITYINAGEGESSDSFSVSVEDKDGGYISPFTISITII